jgi:hypothetical protein
MFLHNLLNVLVQIANKIGLQEKTNVTFDFGLDHLVHGGYGWGRPTQRRKKVIVKQEN